MTTWRISSGAPTVPIGRCPVSEAVEIPPAELSAELLRSIVESVVLREGTDYGAREFSFEEKVGQVIGQIERREARILFDPETQTVDIVLRDV